MSGLSNPILSSMTPKVGAGSIHTGSISVVGNPQTALQLRFRTQHLRDVLIKKEMLALAKTPQMAPSVDLMPTWLVDTGRETSGLNNIRARTQLGPMRRSVKL